MRTFTKDTARSEQGWGAALHVWINERHGRGTAWERHGRGMLCVNPPLISRALFGYPDWGLPWFSSVVRQMPGYRMQSRGTARTLPKIFESFYILSVCKCVLCCCQRVTTQQQLTNISIYYDFMFPRSIPVGFVVDEVALQQVSVRLLRFYPVDIIVPLLHAQLLPKLSLYVICMYDAICYLTTLSSRKRRQITNK
jgi:hypothetical protein